MGISIRQYAQARHVSYEAVRRQVLRYDKELKDHIERTNNTVFLDDEACDFLDMHRQKRAIIIDDEAHQSEIDMLKREIERLKHDKEELKDKLIALHEQQQISDKQTTQLIADKAQTDTLLAIADKMNSELKQELEASKQELNKYHKSFFGFYRKDT